MNEISTAEAAENALPAATRAIQITERIKANGRTAVNAVCAIGKDLRTMKIDKLYTELGYAEFEEYAEKEFQLKRSQTYQYISVYEKLGEEFVASNAQLGITKLALLATANSEDRAEVMENENIAAMTTKELEEILDKYKQQGEQLSMLEEDKKELEEAVDREKADKSRMVFALEQKIKELEKEKEALENAPKEVAVQEIQVPDKKTEAKLKDTEKELKKSEKDLREAQVKIKQLEDNARIEASAIRAEYEEKLQELKGRLMNGENTDKSNFKAMLAAAYQDLTGLIQFIKESEPEERETYVKKVFQIIAMSKDALKDIEIPVEIGGEDNE